MSMVAGTIQEINFEMFGTTTFPTVFVTFTVPVEVAVCEELSTE